MRKRLAAIGIVVGAGLSLAPVATAHPGHSSCAEGAQTFTVPLAQSGQLGALASALGQAGTVAETGAALHDAGCDPRP